MEIDESNNGKRFINAVGGHTYRIYTITKNWELSDVSSHYAFAWGQSINGVESIDLGGVLADGFIGLNDFYDVILPTEAKYLVVRAVGKPMVKIYFVIYDLTLLQTILPFSQSIVINGSPGNAANKNVVRTPILPITDKISKYILFHTNRPNTSKKHQYHYGYALTDSKEDVGSSANIGALHGTITNVDYSYEKRNLYIENPSNAVGISFSIAEYNIVTGEIIPLRDGDLEGYSAFYTTSQNADIFLDEIVNDINTIEHSLQQVKEEITEEFSGWNEQDYSEWKQGYYQDVLVSTNTNWKASDCLSLK